MKDPKVSVVMTVYNEEKFIHDAIKNILQQTFSDFEFIIIDDHSSDNSWLIIKEYAHQDSRIVILRNQENLRIAKSLNKALRLARGKYIIIVDADDVSFRTRLQEQVEFLESNPDYGACGTWLIIIDANGKEIGKRYYFSRDSSLRKIMFRFSPIAHPAACFRKSVFKKVGFYNESLLYAFDYEQILKIASVSKIYNIEKFLVKYRVKERSNSLNKIRRTFLETYRIRRKIAGLYSYKMSFADQLISHIQLVAVCLLPNQLLFDLFNRWRSRYFKPYF